MIRLILAAIFLILYFIITLPVWIVLWIIGKFKPRARQRASQFCVRNGFKVLMFIMGVRMKVKGLEKVPRDVPVLYVSNHQSIIEAMIGYALAVGPMGFVAKAELKKAPLLKQWMDSVHCLFIDRHDMRQSLKVILAAIEEIKSGTSIWICPEGTRNKDPENNLLLEFKDGSFKIADRTGCPIVPVAIDGTWACFERQMPRCKKSRVTVTFGDPFVMKDLEKDDRKAIGEYAACIIGAMIEADRAERKENT